MKPEPGLPFERSRSWSRAFLDLLAPPTCLFCKQTCETEAAVCETCFREFQSNESGCTRCALPESRGTVCPACRLAPPPLDQIIAPYVYDEAVAFLLKRWKYEKQRYCSEIAAKMMLTADFRPKEDDLILPTPLHWRRRLSRGFNQSEDLLHSLRTRLSHGPAVRSVTPGAHTGVKLIRRRATAKQSLADRQQRLRNLAGAFRAVGDVQGRSIVLIDDICTTGATAEGMAVALRDAGAASVRLWCVARTPSHR